MLFRFVCFLASEGIPLYLCSRMSITNYPLSPIPQACMSVNLFSVFW
jgi:hypothetical protein